MNNKVQHYHYTGRMRWDEAVGYLAANYEIIAPVALWGSIDYQRIDREDAVQIIYNHPRPSTPLKTFFLPIRENVTAVSPASERIIIGVPNCDLAGLSLLDKIYLEGEFSDPYYRIRREKTILIGTACHEIAPHCHCTAYGLSPYPEKHHDISLNCVEDKIILQDHTPKGKALLEKIETFLEEEPPGTSLMGALEQLQKATTANLQSINRNLPDYETTGALVADAPASVWNKYARNCVSCGACTTSCPTCTCFLLSDRAGFEKVRSIDACQYPGFERVAAGEDPLRMLASRFKNRYLCKYVWKPARFEVLACTGCGRCIDGCIGDINKNDMFMELADAKITVPQGE